MLLYAKGKLRENQEIVFAGHPGREIRYEVPVSLFKSVQWVVRIFETGKKEYFLSYCEERRFPTPKKPDMDIAHKFFDSFELISSANSGGT